MSLDDRDWERIWARERAREEAVPLPPHKVLSEEEKARVLDKIRRLRDAIWMRDASVDEERLDAVSSLVWRRGVILCRDVGWLRGHLERHGVT